MRFTAEMRAALLAQPRPDAAICAFCRERGHQAFECAQIHNALLEDEIAQAVDDCIARFNTAGCVCTAARKAAERVMSILHRDGWHRQTAPLFVGTRVPVAELGVGP